MNYARKEAHAYAAGQYELAEAYHAASEGEHYGEHYKVAYEDAVKSIQEARSCYPSEDCLQELIDLARNMSQQRVTKAMLKEFAGKLEERQEELSGNSAYALDLLKEI